MSEQPEDRPGETTPKKENSAEPVPASKRGPTPREVGGPKGLEPTRYGDWEVDGRCTDF